MERCAKLIKMIHDEIKKRANNQLSEHNLTMMQIDALMLLGEAADKTLSLKELEKMLHVAQSTSANIIRRLEEKHFVEAFTDADDKRIKMVRITPQGEHSWQVAKASMDEAEEALLAELDEEERTQFSFLLQKVYNGLK